MITSRATGLHGEIDKGLIILAVSWSLASLTTLLIILRVYIWLRIDRKGSAALLWALLALFLSLTSEIALTLSVKYGIGSHLEQIAAAGNLEKFLLWTWIMIATFDIDIAFAKVAAASFLLAVHHQAHPKRRYLLHFIAYSNVGLAIPNFIIDWVHCSPPKALWDPLEQDKCNLDLHIRYTMAAGVWTVASDLIMALLPILLIWPLQMQRRVKIGLCCLMGLGVLAGVAATIRTVYEPRLREQDVSFAAGDLILWGSVEEWLVLIATSVPPVWPLFKPHVSRVVSVSRRSATLDMLFSKRRSTNLQPGGEHRLKSWQQVTDRSDGRSSIPEVPGLPLSPNAITVSKLVTVSEDKQVYECGDRT